MQLRTRDIKAEMVRRDYTAALLARDLGVHRSTVTRVINGEARYPYVLKALASLLGVDVRDLAPGPATPFTPEHIGEAPEGSTQIISGVSALGRPRRGEAASAEGVEAARRAAGGGR